MRAVDVYRSRVKMPSGPTKSTTEWKKQVMKYVYMYMGQTWPIHFIPGGLNDLLFPFCCALHGTRWLEVLCCSLTWVLLEPSSGFIQGHGDQHPQPHPDLLHAVALADPAPTVPTQQEQGYFDSAALLDWPYNHLAFSITVLLLLLIFVLLFPLCRLVSYLLGLLCCILLLRFILSSPPLFSFSFFLFYLGYIMC